MDTINWHEGLGDEHDGYINNAMFCLIKPKRFAKGYYLAIGKPELHLPIIDINDGKNIAQEITNSWHSNGKDWKKMYNTIIPNLVQKSNDFMLVRKILFKLARHAELCDTPINHDELTRIEGILNKNRGEQ